MANTSLFSTSRGQQAPAADTRNEAGGRAYAFSAKHQLAQYAVTGCLNATFYASAETQLDKLVRLASAVEPAFVAKTAIYTRTQGYMKDTPALLCAALATVDTALLERVFDLFQQGDHSLDRAQGGLGIGLTLVHHILELHGGSIEVLSAGPSQGSEFVVRLPADTGVKARRVPKTNEREITLVPPRRILAVDDNVDSADSLTMLLRLAGHSVQVTYDGSKALELAESFKPDAVLLDIGLPGLNGYDTARELRRRRGMKDTLLIALTGYGRDDDRRRAEEAGFDHHLVKPAEFDSLQELLGSSRKPTE